MLVGGVAMESNYGLPPGIDLWQAVTAIVVMGAVTVALRWFPFVAGKSLRLSSLFALMGQALPLGILTILVIFMVLTGEGGISIAALIGVAVAIGLHVWRRNMALSLVGSTLTFIILMSTGL